MARIRSRTSSGIRFQTRSGLDLLQLQGLALEILDLAARCGPRGVARKPSLARFEELFGPAVIQALGNAFAPAQLGDRVLAAQAVQNDADLLFGRELTPRGTADVLDD